jgi:hypothetical protein
MMSEAVIILPNMRGGCATVGGTVHTLFRINNRRPGRIGIPEKRKEDAAARLDQPAASG